MFEISFKLDGDLKQLSGNQLILGHVQNNSIMNNARFYFPFGLILNFVLY